MPARLLDGAAIADAIRAEVRPMVEAFTARAGRPPGLGLVLVGADPASALYVTSKLKSAAETGLRADLERLPATASIEDLLRVVDRLNRSDAHDGILVQSPLPEAMGPDAERRVFDALSPDKDVDGFHPINVGRLVQNRPALVACTPAGIIELLERSTVPIAGARAVVIGRSDIVGKPMALLLLHRHATVTICHSRTVNLPQLAREADILVAARGGRRSSPRHSSNPERPLSTSARRAWTIGRRSNGCSRRARSAAPHSNGAGRWCWATSIPPSSRSPAR